MRIVFFTSIYSSETHRLNAYRLIKAYPEFEYIYVSVDNRRKYGITKLKNIIKQLLSLFELKKTEWYSIREKTETQIAKEVPGGFDSHIKRIIVPDINGPAAEKVIKELAPDIMIQHGAGILKENIFSIPKIGTINVHHGIAPEIRGISSVFWALYYGLYDYIGTTVHFVDKTLDTGTIIVQQKTNLPKEYNYLDTFIATVIQGSELLPKAVKIICSNYDVKEEEVKSYYFSMVSEQHYSELQKNAFKPVGQAAILPFKMKKKRVIKVP